LQKSGLAGDFLSHSHDSSEAGGDVYGGLVWSWRAVRTDNFMPMRN